MLVENAPEAVVVLDVGSGRFVDCNENAAEFFKMPREQLLRVGPQQVSPAEQADGTPSFGVNRGHVDKALAGEAPVFEWLHQDAQGTLIPSEVRFLRLPSSTGGLISLVQDAARAEVRSDWLTGLVTLDVTPE